MLTKFWSRKWDAVCLEECLKRQWGPCGVVWYLQEQAMASYFNQIFRGAPRGAASTLFLCTHSLRLHTGSPGENFSEPWICFSPHLLFQTVCSGAQGPRLVDVTKLCTTPLSPRGSEDRCSSWRHQGRRRDRGTGRRTRHATVALAMEDLMTVDKQVSLCVAMSTSAFALLGTFFFFWRFRRVCLLFCLWSLQWDVIHILCNPPFILYKSMVFRINNHCHSQFWNIFITS